MDPVLLGEILSLVMFVFACGLLILGYPVALTLAGSGLAFALLGTILGVFGRGGFDCEFFSSPRPPHCGRGT